ncbi:MAG TPA: class I SAM-dependent methyltransferase [Stackebrandtia sp.]|uniref:class I SAM-dependent methyltransferase n=1 Tax=Stackebrandtia sp. TaxID=2023065 RepID=UPI002D6C835D|nr:class I SAM-dependent methyltransferase [Stackebrandtia sp.]HZE40636.1 class I SAM-dependent methyltransferase [Stackebrandtia sp.]
MPTSPPLSKLSRYWDKQSPKYDRKMAFADRKFFGDTRQWICDQASGEVLEVAIGTGLNMHLYPVEVTLTGMDLSPDMLALARKRAARLGFAVDLTVGDAEHLDFADASFDTVVCTFGLCAVPDEAKAIAEMVRVLRPGGLLLLGDHVVSTSAPIRAVQALIEVFSVRLGNENFRRRPIRQVREAGLTIERHSRFKKGMVERLAARKPESP